MKKRKYTIFFELRKCHLPTYYWVLSSYGKCACVMRQIISMSDLGKDCNQIPRTGAALQSCSDADNKCSRTHYHESQIISSSQTTMPVAFFTLQDSFFCSGMDCQIFIVQGIILVCHTRCLSFTEWQGDFFPSVLSAVR